MKSTAIDVSIPEIKITVADLSYMKSIENGGIRCNPPNGVKDRLTFMGLIKYGKIPPCPKQMAEWEANQPKLWKRASEAIRAKDANALKAVADDLSWKRKRPEPRNDYFLTKAGRDLLAKGKAKSETVVGSHGCVK